MVSEKYTFHATRYYVGVQETRQVNGNSAYPDMWYAWFAFGAVVHQISGSIEVEDKVTSERYLYVADPVNDTRFGQALGLGYIVRLDRTVGVDLSASLEGVWTKRYTSTGSQTIGISGYSFDFKAGLTFLLGAKPN